jgi:hypothetical protein
MAWFKKPDLSLSNEYQDLRTGGGCINCGALREVLKSQNIHNLSTLQNILTSAPICVNDPQEGCWAYAGQSDYPTCLHGLTDDDPKVVEARDQIKRARQAVKDIGEQTAKERAKRLRKVQNRSLP